MSVVAPPEPPRPDELEALIREARARQRKRRLGAAALVALLAGVVLGIGSIVSGGSAITSRSGAPTVAVKAGKACRIRVEDMRIVDTTGHTLYREPGSWTRNYPHPSVVRCSGSTAWVVWDNGAAMNQEGYVGAHSVDGGRTWHLVFAESYFGVNAPHELDSYLGPWTLVGKIAYFTGSCPACSPGPTISLWVTKDGGQTFRKYAVPALTGYAPAGVRVSRDTVTIVGKPFSRGATHRKTATLRVD
jgi:hypothetical protein